MCSERERLFRQINNLLHPFEVGMDSEVDARKSSQCPPVADAEKVVKEFRRPAADAVRPYPWEIRPPAVLVQTMVYLRESVLLPSTTDGTGFSLQV